MGYGTKMDHLEYVRSFVTVHCQNILDSDALDKHRRAREIDTALKDLLSGHGTMQQVTLLDQVILDRAKELQPLSKQDSNALGLNWLALKRCLYVRTPKKDK